MEEVIRTCGGTEYCHVPVSFLISLEKLPEIQILSFHQFNGRKNHSSANSFMGVEAIVIHGQFSTLLIKNKNSYFYI